MNKLTSLTRPAFNTADIADQLGPLARCVPMQWLRLGGRPSFHGTLSTLRCREADASASIDIGVFALGTVPARASGELTGARDVPVVLGGTTLHPGDHVFCDGDGLVVCSAKDVRDIVFAQKQGGETVF